MRVISIAVTSLALVLGACVGAVAGPGTDGVKPSYDVRTATAPPGKASPGGTTFVGRTDGFLTAPSSRSAAEVTRSFLRGNAGALGLTTGDIADLEVSDAYTSGSGVRHLTFDQVADGVAVHGGEVKANVDPKGRLINVSGDPVSGLALDTTTPDLTKVQALHRARADVGAEPTGGFAAIESASLVAFPHGKDAELAWDVWVDSADGILYETVVSATTGKVLSRVSRTAFDSASVWDNHPRSDQAPRVVDLAADPTWLDDSAGKTRLAGNNAHAYADVNANNVADAGENIASVGGNWNFATQFFSDAGCPTWSCTWQAATPAVNQSPQTTGLFYLVNRFHDHLLSAPIGFTEASRNFEQVNSSGAPGGGDRVLAEANDGSSLNNANFSTPPDGSPPRMQQFLADLSGNRVTTSDSADVVFHEYTHGLSNRLVGNASGLDAAQSGAMGEAWSDFYANDFLVATGEKTDGAGIDLLLGEYAFGPTGIRKQPMDCNPGSDAASCPANGTSGTGGFTFGDLGTFTVNGVHDNGEIWSQTLWDLREKIGAVNARTVVTDGMRLTPNTPTFLQARDAILQATLVRGLPQKPVWEVFAARGMGYSATTPGPTTYDGEVEAFDIPEGVRHVSTTVQDLGGLLGDADGVLEPGETLRTVTRLQSIDVGPVTGVTGVVTASDPAVVVSPGSTSWADLLTMGGEADSAPTSLTVPASVPCGSTFDLDLAVTSSAGAYAVPTKRVSLGTPVFTNASPAVAIPDNNATGVATTMTLPAGTVRRMEVSIPSLTHTWVGDLKVTLTSPAGTVVTLLDRPGAGSNGSSADNFTNLFLADDAPAPIESIGNAGPITGRWAPNQPLATFEGEQAGGTWTLRVSDNAAVDTGTLQTWGLTSSYACSTTAAAAPTAETGAARDIGAASATLAGTIDALGAPTEVAFEIGTTTAYGRLTATASAGSGTGASAQSAVVDGLSPGTTYHVRILGLRDGVVVVRGADRTFTTLTQSCVDARAAVVAAQGALAQADAALASANQRLTGVAAAETLAAANVTAAKAQVAKAKKALKKAKKALKKAKATGTAAQVAKAVKRVKKAKKALKRALARLASAQAALTTAQATTASARTAAGQAAQARAAAAAALTSAEQTAATQCGSPG